MVEFKIIAGLLFTAFADRCEQKARELQHQADRRQEIAHRFKLLGEKYLSAGIPAGRRAANDADANNANANVA